MSLPKDLRMDRLERTEVFGDHVIAATVSREPDISAQPRWELRVSVMRIGGKPDAPLLQFPIVQPDQADPADALDAAVDEARRILSQVAAQK
jgi:hypothetical protein